jgi:hypothetical protein
MKNIQYVGIAIFLLGLLAFSVIPFIGDYRLEEEIVRENVKDIHQEQLLEVLSPMYGQTYTSNFRFIGDFNKHFNTYNEDLKERQEWDNVIWDDYAFVLTKASSVGPVNQRPYFFLMISVVLAVIGGLMYILPLYRNEPDGIKNDGIYFSSMKSRGLLGIIT